MIKRLLFVALLLATTRVEAAWPSTGSYTAWSKCFKITTQASKIDGALDWYWLDLDDMPIEFWNTVKTDGGDLRFVEDDLETAINHRLIFIDTVTDTGLVAVAQPHGGSGATVDIDSYVFVGNAAAADPGISPFPGTVEALWMLQEAPTSTTAITDYSGNSRGSTNIAGVMTSGDLIAAGPHSSLKCIDFDSNDRITFPATIFNDIESSLTFTFWSWAKVEDEDTDRGLFGSAGNQFATRHKLTGAGEALIRSSTNASNFTVNTSPAFEEWFLDVWVMVHVVWDGSTLKFYHNGVEKGSASALSLRSVDLNYFLGSDNTTYWNGKIGETGIASNALTANQIATMHTNSTDSTFWVIAEHTGGGGGMTVQQRTRGFF